jgi:hypothetical protein
MKKYFYIMSALICTCLLCAILFSREVEFFFINSSTNKVPYFKVYIDEKICSEFHCAPGFPPDRITLNLKTGKHLIRIVSIDPEQNWSSSFWVIWPKYYQVYFTDDLGKSDSLIFNFENRFVRYTYQ